MHELSPYPLFFCPPGLAKPDCCPHMGSLTVMPGHGPDKTGGTCWGGAFDPNAATWSKSPAGWWLGMSGQTPQHLCRLETHPRVRRWRTIPGAFDGHWWRIPVLLTPCTDDPDQGLISALDRLWDGKEWTASEDLAPMQEPLRSLVFGIHPDQDLERRNAVVRALAVGLLAVGHWVDADFLATTRWLSEKLMVETVLAACDLEPKAAQEVERAAV